MISDREKQRWANTLFPMKAGLASKFLILATLPVGSTRAGVLAGPSGSPPQPPDNQPMQFLPVLRGSAFLRHPMHIRFTEQELATLVEMLSLAANVASWNQKETADRNLSEYEAFESKMLEKAAHSGLGNMIEFDEETKRFRVKKDVEETLFYHECYEEFRNESFWDELTVRLADRDLMKSIGIKAWEAMSEEQRRAKTVTWEKRYWQEFSKNGIDRVIVMTPPGEG